MALPRGFMAEAPRLAAQVRTELGLTPLAALDPWQLAKHLAIPVVALSSYRDQVPDACRVLLGVERSYFSALVACVGTRRVIVHNDSHAITRQRANISHELAHVLLFHECKAANGGWLRTYDADQEDEAKWLGGVLLVSDEACIAACRAGLPLREAAARMGVSEELTRWRLNKSGAARRVSRERARRAA